jgi:hypothetical protein
VKTSRVEVRKDETTENSSEELPVLLASSSNELVASRSPLKVNHPKKAIKSAPNKLPPVRKKI